SCPPSARRAWRCKRRIDQATVVQAARLGKQQASRLHHEVVNPQPVAKLSRMAEVHSWHNHPDAPGVVRQAVQALSAGRLVAFPTETGYVVAANARVPDAVDRLRALPRADNAPLTLAV